MVTVIIPVLNEAATIASVVAFARSAPGVTEVLVVDDGSTDDTFEEAQRAGARVLTSTLLGKGASMEDGMRAATNDLLVFLDGDLSGLDADLIQRLTRPLLDDTADFVKARFSRRAGRVTVLTAIPLLQTFFPELARFAQPLGGIIAARRSTLSKLRFESQFGVDVGLLIDATLGGARVCEVDIGHIEHASQPLKRLGRMAKQVTRVVLDRAALHGRLSALHLRSTEELDRHAQAQLPAIVERLGRPERLALIDMDGTLLRGRFILALARATGSESKLMPLLDHPQLDAAERTASIARLFRGVSMSSFEKVARRIPLVLGARRMVIALKKEGYRVGIVSDSFRVATEIVRRRVFADFSVAHVLRFRQGLATGDIAGSPAMQRSGGCSEHRLCKLNVLLNLCERLGVLPAQVLAIGDGEPDMCMLRAAGISVAFEPKTPRVAEAATHRLEGSLLDVLSLEASMRHSAAATAV